MSEADPFGQPRSSSHALLERLFRGFSCPQEGLDEAFMELVSVERARQITHLFLQGYAMELNRRSKGLVSLLERWLGSETEFATSWEMSWGELYKPLLTDSASDLASAVSSVALWLGACGVPGEWSVTLERPVRLRWGRWLLPAADSIAVQSNEKSSRISARLENVPQEARFERIAEEWEAADGAQRLSEFGTRYKQITLLPSEGVPKTFDIDFDLLPYAVSELQPEMVETCQNTVAFLEKYAPVYLWWVLRVVRHLLLLKPDPTTSSSGSDQDTPGLIYMSYTSELPWLAESLVHEASHQYMMMLHWLGPLDDGTDTNLYYSPLKQTGRPLSRIALAYHAVGNILLFYRLCRATGAPDNGYWARQEPRATAQLKQLEAPLRNNPALTSIGQALCHPLMERLDTT
jgi:HEXXH motif-containing protein